MINRYEAEEVGHDGKPWLTPRYWDGQHTEEAYARAHDIYVSTCSKCGGEYDAEGWCARYCLNDD